MAHTEGLTGLSALVGATALVEAGGTEATGQVSAVEGSIITVGLDDDTFPAGRSDDVVVSVFAPDALYRLTGRTTLTGRDLVTSGDATVERVQRRRWPRRQIDLAVTVCPVSDGVRLEGVPGRTVDVGIGGCCVETLRPVGGEGDPMLILSLPDGTAIVSGASSLTCEDLGDGWRYRLAFRDLDAHDAGRLAELTS